MTEISDILNYCKVDMFENFSVEATARWVVKTDCQYIEIAYTDGPACNEVVKRYRKFFNNDKKEKMKFVVKRDYSEKTIERVKRDFGLKTDFNIRWHLKAVDLVNTEDEYEPLHT